MHSVLTTHLLTDEGQNSITNAGTISSRAVLSLDFHHALLLSGTPAQNKLADLDVSLALLLHRSKRKCFLNAEAARRKADQGSKTKKQMNPNEVVDSYTLTNVRNQIYVYREQYAETTTVRT